jgi:hypothetical protein
MSVANVCVAGMSAELELTGSQYNVALTVYVLSFYTALPKLTTTAKVS